MLKTYIKAEFNRAFFSKQTILTVCLSIALFVLGMIDVLSWITSGSTSVFYAFTQGYNSGTTNFLVYLKRLTIHNFLFFTL